MTSPGTERPVRLPQWFLG